jgi:hypothetical protein
MRLWLVPTTARPHPSLNRALCVFALGSLSAIALSPEVGKGLLQNSYPQIPSAVNRMPDAPQMNGFNESRQRQLQFDAVNAERKRQLGDDTAMLLKLAADLKIEADKTDKDTLSLNVIRKAAEIEKLAHTVKERMKLTLSSNAQSPQPETGGANL